MGEGEKVYLGIILEILSSLTQNYPQEAEPSLSANLRADQGNEEDGGGRGLHKDGTVAWLPLKAITWQRSPMWHYLELLCY